MENGKEMQVVEANENELADVLDIIESRNAIFMRVMSVAIQATNPSDWIDQDGKPYLQGSGAEKVARRFAVRVYDVSHELENHSDDNGNYYMYITTGKVGLGSGKESIEAVGTCSSRDKLFSHGGKKKLEDVDRGNVMKKSYTNFLVNGITRLLGIRNLTWAELEKYGITKNGKGVNYKGQAQKAAETKTATKAESGSKKPYWFSDYNGKSYLHAKIGAHFSNEFLSNLGMKASTKTAGQYSAIHSPELENALEEEFIAAEESLAMQEGSAQ